MPSVQWQIQTSDHCTTLSGYREAETLCIFLPITEHLLKKVEESTHFIENELPQIQGGYHFMSADSLAARINLLPPNKNLNELAFY